MSKFEILRASHLELLDKLNNHAQEDLSQPINELIEELRKGGGDVYSAQERFQMQEFIRFWSTKLYELDHNRGYQIIDLDVYSGRPVKSRSSVWFYIFPVSILIIIIWFSFSSKSPLFAPTPTYLVNTPTMRIVVINSETKKTPTLTATPTLTTTPTINNTTQIPIATETLEPPLMLVNLFSPSNGDVVFPELEFKGLYNNLSEEWSIHVVLQPLSKSGKYFPINEYFQIPVGISSGNWLIKADLSEQFDIELPDTYVSTIVLANNDELRRKLSIEAKNGLTTLPKGILELSNQPVTFRRKAYQHIQGDYLIFSSYVGPNSNNEIFLAKVDGSEVYQITNTPEIWEIEPALSPDGKQIVSVGTRRISSQERLMGLWVMDSNGHNQRPLIEEKGRIYEEPEWSPDGRYIAYASSTIFSGSAGKWDIYIYDLFEDLSIQLTSDVDPGRYPSWMPDSKTIVFDHNYGISRISTDNPGRIKTIWNTDDAETQPSVSKNGKFVSFIGYSDPTGPHDIYILDLETKISSKITNGGFFILPHWYENDTKIICQTMLKETYRLYAFDIEIPIPIKSFMGNNIIFSSNLLRGVEGGSSPEIGYYEAYFEIQQ